VNERTAIQDQLPHNHCYGCGADNDLGLQIKSYWDGSVATCEYQPRPEQCAGPTHLVYGGTIASLIDCHSVCTAIAQRYALEGRPVGDGELIWYVTGKLDIDYRAPTPIDQPVTLLASIVEAGEKKSVVRCTLSSGGLTTAEASVIAVRVPSAWFSKS
jgi:acyl-coenzyme A thioesterase PaaI-like protein